MVVSQVGNGAVPSLATKRRVLTSCQCCPLLQVPHRAVSLYLTHSKRGFLNGALQNCSLLYLLCSTHHLLRRCFSPLVAVRHFNYRTTTTTTRQRCTHSRLHCRSNNLRYRMVLFLHQHFLFCNILTLMSLPTFRYQCNLL